MREVSRQRKGDLYDHLRDSILTLHYRPGSDLDEVRLAEEFGLSRTPLREVFRQLAGEGYLELRENRGARVSEMSYQTMRDFFLAAPMVYGAVLRLAAMNATTTQVAALKNVQDEFRKALTDGDAAERALLNNRFHEITGEMAGNIYLLPSFNRLLIDHVRISMTFYRPQDDLQAENVEEAARQHDQIITAIENRDEAEAARLADAHWKLSRDRIELYVMPQALDVPFGELARSA